MNDLESDLTLLENLSKKISDLIYNNQFTQISQIDKQRRAIIEKIKNSETSHLQIKSRINSHRHITQKTIWEKKVSEN